MSITFKGKTYHIVKPRTLTEENQLIELADESVEDGAAGALLELQQKYDESYHWCGNLGSKTSKDRNCNCGNYQSKKGLKKMIKPASRRGKKNN